MLTVENPSPEVLKQRHCMEYILRSVLEGPSPKDKSNLQRLRLLVHGPGGCGKSVVTRAAAHMLRQSERGVVLAAPTGVAAFNINGTTLHTSLQLPVQNQSYGKVCDLPLPRGEQLANLQSIWKHADVLMVDEMSFVSAEILERMDQNLRLARDMPHHPFGGVHVIFIGDLYQLPPPGGQVHPARCSRNSTQDIPEQYYAVICLIFARLRAGRPIFASKLWNLFELCELEGNQRAARDPAWAALLARVRLGQWTDEDIRTLEGLVLPKHGKRQPAPGAVHLFATRAAVVKRNRRYIHDYVESTNADLFDCPAVDISVGSGAPLPPEKAWPEAENTGGLEFLLQLAEGAKVMLRKNLDVRDGLANGACGVVQHIDAHSNREVQKVWVKFEKGAGSNWEAANETNSVAIHRCTAPFQDKNGNKADRRQFPLVLAKAVTIHKSQAATYHAGAHVRLDKYAKQEGQAYVALSRSPTQSLCTLEHFDKSCLRFNVNAQRALVILKEQQARGGAFRKAALQDLWEKVVRPAESHAYYKALLQTLPRPDWRLYDEEQQRAQGGPAEKEAHAAEGKLTCPRCGWVADNAVQYKKHRPSCPARSAAKAKAKAKRAPKPKAKPNASQGKRSTSRPSSAAAPPPPAKAPRSEDEAPAPDSPPPLPPPADPPPPGLEPPAPCFFFQRQQAARCGMHAFNNALGRTAFRAQDMETAAQSYLQALQGIDHARDEHVRPGGWYSVQVLYAALFNCGYRLNIDAPIRSLQQAHLVPALVQNWHNQHWVAYRWGHDGAIYRLDSMDIGPHRMSDEEFEASLAAHLTYAITHPSDA